MKRQRDDAMVTSEKRVIPQKQRASPSSVPVVEGGVVRRRGVCAGESLGLESAVVVAVVVMGLSASRLDWRVFGGVLLCEEAVALSPTPNFSTMK